MSGGEISGNTANGGGGVGNEGTLTMKGGKIVGNTASNGGGGGVNSKGTFTMEGGEISGNKASSSGGGVSNSGTFTFTKTGGTIYGDTDTTHTAGSTENTATNGNGHAVYSATNNRKRDTTAGPTVNLNSATAANWE
jgi:hypothetical protein